MGNFPLSDGGVGWGALCSMPVAVPIPIVVVAIEHSVVKSTVAEWAVGSCFMHDL